MNKQETLHWYAVYTKPRWEKKVAELLSKKAVINYCPLNKVRKQWHDRKKTILEPLFTSYVFVQTSVAQHSYIKAVPGVLNFVHWLGKPALIRNAEIEMIQAFLGEHESVELQKIPVNLTIDDRVTIVRGPLMHKEGRIVQVMNNAVKVELPSLGFTLVARLDKAHVQLQEAAVIGRQ